VPGARVHVRVVRPLDDLYELDVDGRRLVTGRGALEGVWAEVASGGRRGR
jgi:hypothetical protein